MSTLGVLGIILAVMFMRLTKELHQLGDDTEAMFVRIGRVVRTVQVAAPVIALVKKMVWMARRGVNLRR